MRVREKMLRNQVRKRKNTLRILRKHSMDFVVMFNRTFNLYTNEVFIEKYKWLNNVSRGRCGHMKLTINLQDCNVIEEEG